MRIPHATCWLLLAVGGGVLGAVLGASTTAQDGSDPPGARVVALKDQLRTGLRTERPQDLAFIASVVDLVDSRRLPRDLVASTFVWARKKQPQPFPYFERALRLRAAKLGITIPRAPQ
jgi:hypothetical protein